MNIALTWLLYIFVVAIIYVLLSFTGLKNSVEMGTRLFFAFVVGALITFILAPGVVLTTSDDRTWYALLIFVAFLTPIVLAVWLLLSHRWKLPGQGNGDCVLERTVECIPGEGCQVVNEQRLYSSGSDVMGKYRNNERKGYYY